MRRGHGSSLAAVFFVAASLGATEVRLLADAPLSLLAVKPVMPSDCAFSSWEQGARVSCSSWTSLKLTLQKPGFEPRTLVVSGNEQEIDLRDDWVPLPTRMQLTPPELTAGAVALWREGTDVIARPTENGLVEGPRLWGERPVKVLVVGPHLRGSVVTVGPDSRGQFVVVPLLPGRSAAVVCRDPWAGKPVAHCRGELGRPLTNLARMGSAFAWSLKPEGELKALEGLLLLQLPEESQEKQRWLLLSSEGLGPILRPFPAALTVVEEYLPLATTVRVELQEDDGKEIQGDITVAAEVEGVAIRLLRKATDHSGVAEVSLPPGTYLISAEAEGFAPKREGVTVGPRTKKLGFTLERRATVRGNVVSLDGAPVPGATVLCLGEGLRLEGERNLAETSEDGGFSVTAPGRGPWVLAVEKEGFARATRRVVDAKAPLTLVLVPVCEVVVNAVGPNGVALHEPLAAFRDDQFSVVLGEMLDESGRYLFRLGPGRWMLVAENSGLWGSVNVPQFCTDLQLTVALSPGRPASRAN